MKGSFRKARVKPLRRYGSFRGDGQITVSDAGVSVEGRHVYPLWVRLAIAVAAAVVVLVATGGRFIPGVLLLYPLVEYVILKREKVSVAWVDVAGFAVDPAKQLVAIDLGGFPHDTSPVVIRTDEWSALLASLRARHPSVERSEAGP